MSSSRKHSINYHVEASDSDLEKHVEQVEDPLYLIVEDIQGNVDVAADVLKGQELSYTEEGGS